MPQRMPPQLDNLRNKSPRRVKGWMARAKRLPPSFLSELFYLSYCLKKLSRKTGVNETIQETLGSVSLARVKKRYRKMLSGQDFVRTLKLFKQTFPTRQKKPNNNNERIERRLGD